MGRGRVYALCAALVASFLVGSAALGHAQGFIIPADLDVGSPELVDHRAEVGIADQVAEVAVQQVFRNPGSRELQGVYYFPLPTGATVKNFTMWVNGEPVGAELLEAERARDIYEEIVRRRIDPGLLEFVDHQLLRARIFPIPPGKERRIRVEYTQLLEHQNGLVRFVYPLRATSASPGSTPRNTGVGNGVRAIQVKIKGSATLHNIYSPSHAVEIVQKDDHHALVSYESAETADADDFVLYYGLEDREFGLNWLCHKAAGDEDGYFMIMVSPKVRIPRSAILKKDLVFVLDVSGSMAGEKIEQAKQALRDCITKLDDRDRFNILAFSSGVRLFKERLVNAAEFRKAALDFVRALEAQGGTNINEALLTALDLKGGDAKTRFVVFITDGLPTVGVTNVGEIRKSVARLNRKNFRIFTFGVGYDVNTHLLNGIARDNRGAAEYIEAEDDIERTISTFYERINHPVLSAIELDYGDVQVYDVYPREIPDLFKGSQLTVLGRYKTSGRTVVRLRGALAEEERTFSYPVAFASVETQHDFLPRLWASRKIGYLMEQIQLNGFNEELRDEIVALSTKYGVMTPYTSYLVREAEAVTWTGGDPGAAGAPMLFEALDAGVGKQAVAFSKASRRMQEASAVNLFDSANMRHVAGRTLVQGADGFWRDVAYKDGTETLNVKYGSEAYWLLLRQYPGVKKFLSLCERVIFRFQGKYIRIAPDSGSERITPQALEAFFADDGP